MATFKWSIDNFSSFLDKGEGWTNSRVFKIMGHDWYGLQLQLSFSALQFVASLSSYFLQLELLHIYSLVHSLVCHDFLAGT